MAGFTELFDYSARQNRKIEKILEEIKERQKIYEERALEEFPLLTEEFKKRLENGETLEDIKVDAYAAIAEAFKKLQKKNYPEDENRNGYYDEQIKTSLVLSNGDLAQMLTGEGKTYALTLSAYLSALKGKGVHILTSNEYLAQRDYEENKELFETMGLKAAFVSEEDPKEKKKEAYDCDITYATPTTIAFDYLKDNMTVSKEEKVMRDLSACILDEVDSSLIDEANNPYIISSPDKIPEKFYKDVNQIIASLRGKVVEASLEKVYDDVEKMEKDTAYLDFIGSKNDFNIFLTDVGVERVNRRLKELGYEDKIEKIDGKETKIEPQAYMGSFIRNALVANYIMQNKNDYLVSEKQIKVINRETGRIAVGSSFGNGLHQAIEAKENLDISESNITLTSINQPSLFKLYSSFSGLSGTLLSAKDEFKEIYKKEIVVISPRKGMNRVDESSTICETEEEKYKEILKEVQKGKEKGQPILIGTESIEESERVSKFLRENNIENRLLNAGNPNEEAEIIAKAGEVGAITVTTNIAGRGTDIKVSEEALEKGGLYILGSSLSESKRIDDQLRGRSGRQGNIGKSKFIISLEDSIFKKHYIPEKLIKFKNVLKKKTQKELQNIVKKFQKKIELDAFALRQKRNEIESVSAFYREHFDKENDIIRNAENVEEIFLSILDSKLEEDRNKESFIQKYESFKEEDPKKLVQKIKEVVEKRLTEEKEKLGKDKFSYKLKESILDASKEAWIDFINDADNRKIQAEMNSNYKQCDMTEEYLRISDDAWNMQMSGVQDQIIQNVIDRFTLIKDIQKEEKKENREVVEKVEPKREKEIEKEPLTRDKIIKEVSAMFYYKDNPEKITYVEGLWEANKNKLAPMDRKLIESSIKVARKGYIKRLKERITHIETEEELIQLERETCTYVIPEEEKKIIETMIEEVKNNLSPKIVSRENSI